MDLWTLRIRVEGLSLWLDRGPGKHIDVLFPDDGQADEKRHFLTIDGAGDPKLLDGAVLDLTGLPAELPDAPQLAQIGWLPVTIHAGSLAEAPDAVLTGAGTIGGLRLPRAHVVQVDPYFEGPFEYEGKPVYLGFGVEWICPCHPVPEVEAVRVTQGSGAAGTKISLGRVDAQSRTMSLTVKCLSRHDRDNPDSPLNPGDALDEFSAYTAVTRNATSQGVDIPRYHGGTNMSPSQLALMSATARMDVHPKKPCTGVYGAV